MVMTMMMFMTRTTKICCSAATAISKSTLRHTTLGVSSFLAAFLPVVLLTEKCFGVSQSSAAEKTVAAKLNAAMRCGGNFCRRRFQVFTRPIGTPITGCAHWHRQRPQHPSDRTHQMSDIPRPSDSFGSIRRDSDPTAEQTCRHIAPRGVIIFTFIRTHSSSQRLGGRYILASLVEVREWPIRHAGSLHTASQGGSRLLRLRKES